MKLMNIALAAAFSAGSVPAFAGDQVIDLAGGNASFAGSSAESPLLSGGVDEISFVNLAAGTYNFVLSLNAQYVAGLAATLNGQTVSFTPLGTSANAFTGYLEGTSTAPWVLTIYGSASRPASNYAGLLSVTAVPEPGTYALLMAGLGVVGFIARRRRPQQSR